MEPNFPFLCFSEVCTGLYNTLYSFISFSNTHVIIDGQFSKRALFAEQKCSFISFILLTHFSPPPICVNIKFPILQLVYNLFKTYSPKSRIVHFGTLYFYFAIDSRMANIFSLIYYPSAVYFWLLNEYPFQPFRLSASLSDSLRLWSAAAIKF